eukprot:15387898-Alexandrium_andersonii.AAC.1
MGSHSSSAHRASLRHRTAPADSARGNEGRPTGNRCGPGQSSLQGGPLVDRRWLRARPRVP